MSSLPGSRRSWGPIAALVGAGLAGPGCSSGTNMKDQSYGTDAALNYVPADGSIIVEKKDASTATDKGTDATTDSAVSTDAGANADAAATVDAGADASDDASGDASGDATAG